MNWLPANATPDDWVTAYRLAQRHALDYWLGTQWELPEVLVAGPIDIGPQRLALIKLLTDLRVIV